MNAGFDRPGFYQTISLCIKSLSYVRTKEVSFICMSNASYAKRI